MISGLSRNTISMEYNSRKRSRFMPVSWKILFSLIKTDTKKLPSSVELSVVIDNGLIIYTKESKQYLVNEITWNER